MECCFKSCDRSVSSRWLASEKLVANGQADQNVAFRTVGGDGNTTIDVIAKLRNTHVRGLSLSFKSNIVLVHATGRVVSMYSNDQDGRARYGYLKGLSVSLYSREMTELCAETRQPLTTTLATALIERPGLRWTAALVNCLEVRQRPAN